MRRVRLRLVTAADFRRSDASIWQDIEADHAPLLATFEPTDVVAVRSGTGGQVMFITAPVSLGDRLVYRSERLRLSRGAWNPIMLATYARMVGLELANLPTLEQILGPRLARAVRAAGQ